MTPELPNPVSLGVGYFDEHIFGHTKDQLIEYGKLVEAATREECASVCDERANGENDAQWCADRIRSMK